MKGMQSVERALALNGRQVLFECGHIRGGHSCSHVEFVPYQLMSI